MPGESAYVPGGHTIKASTVQLQQSSTGTHAPNLPSGAPEVHCVVPPLKKNTESSDSKTPAGSRWEFLKFIFEIAL